MFAPTRRRMTFTVMAVLILMGLGLGLQHSRAQAQESSDSHPCPTFPAFDVVIGPTSFATAETLSFTATSPSGNCRITTEIPRPVQGTEAADMEPGESCVVSMAPSRHETGLMVELTRRGLCEGIEATTTILITPLPPAGGVTGQSGSGRRLAKAVTSGLDPVSAVMFFQRLELSWTYTPDDVTEWTWDITRSALPSWAAASYVIGEGNSYDIVRREVSLWQKAFWRSPDGFEDASGVAMDVSITTRSQVVGLPSGAYSCAFWDSDWTGIWSVLGVKLINLKLAKVCWAS